jgi:molybdopterin-synthase adenylyltransferase
MMPPRPLLLLPSSAAGRIVVSQDRWGWLNLRVDRAEQLVMVVAFSEQERVTWPVTSPLMDTHYLQPADQVARSGLWYRARPDLHAHWLTTRTRSAQLTVEGFRQLILGGWQVLPVDRAVPVLTWTQLDGQPAWQAWWAARDGMTPADVHLIDEAADVFAPLSPAWPVELLAGVLVTVIGVGSIGSAAVEALAAYAVGRLALVDPDRLLQHNLARHRAGARHLGRPKVHAVAAQLAQRFPALDVEPLPLNVVDDADVMRPLVIRSDLVLVCADGVTPRRVANHLAVWARRPIVLTCVLEDGAVGEVLRVRPGSGFGCLLCHRAELQAAGRLDPEPGLDLPYGTGLQHRPMTAVGGDLALVGEFAAKAAVATLLEARGYHDQRLPAEHAVLGLRPVPGLTPPFDVTRAGDVRWSSVGPPRPSCPTCGQRP